MPQMAPPESVPETTTRHQLIWLLLVVLPVTTKKATNSTKTGTKKEATVTPTE